MAGTARVARACLFCGPSWPRAKKLWKNSGGRQSPNSNVVGTAFAVRPLHKSERFLGGHPKSQNQLHATSEASSQSRKQHSSHALWALPVRNWSRMILVGVAGPTKLTTPHNRLAVRLWCCAQALLVLTKFYGAANRPMAPCMRWPR